MRFNHVEKERKTKKNTHEKCVHDPDFRIIMGYFRGKRTVRVHVWYVLIFERIELKNDEKKHSSFILVFRLVFFIQSTLLMGLRAWKRCNRSITRQRFVVQKKNVESGVRDTDFNMHMILLNSDDELTIRTWAHRTNELNVIKTKRLRRNGE